MNTKKQERERRDSEFRAYVFIENSLKELGWNVKNPNRYADGEVYNQGECLNNSIIKEHLQTVKPENVVIVKTNIFWVIEAKPQHKQLEQAIKECKDYCKLLNKAKILAPFFSAVVGDDDNSYIVKNYYFYNGEWTEIEINDKKTTGFLDKALAREIIDKNNPFVKDHEIPDEVYYQKAIKINEILHNGSINKNNRARVVATMLLALLKDSYINRENDCFSMINELNSRAEVVLFEKDKRAFIDCIKISVPPTPDNHIKFRKALLETMQELDSINIRSAMNSGTDILGRFYEQFLKYGNGSKEIGIVLTPRHITKFAVEVLNITSKDKVLDPACGTGGFLVSAFDKVKNEVEQEELENFKINGIYGIEQDPEVVALALVNMIFRGDGRANLEEGNCFTTNKFKDLKVSKVLMNPPFALKKGDEKEYKFIDFALNKMEKGGYLFAIVPSTIMFKGGGCLTWRKSMLENNTLKAVIKLPDDLFYPVSVCSSAIIIQKGIPQDRKKPIFWGVLNDGFTKKKGVMVKTEHGTINNIKDGILSYINGISIQNNENYCINTIEYDNKLECAPEYYLLEKQYSENKIYISIRNIIIDIVQYCLKRGNRSIYDNILEKLQNKPKAIRCNDLTEIFDICSAKSMNIEDYGNGTIPFVTSTTLNNAVEMFIEPSENDRYFEAFNISISSFGYANIQVEKFVARSHGAVLVLRPKKHIELSLQELLFYTACLNLQKWRFSYGRWVTEDRLKKIKLQDIDTICLDKIKEIFNEVLSVVR